MWWDCTTLLGSPLLYTYHQIYDPHPFEIEIYNSHGGPRHLSIIPIKDFNPFKIAKLVYDK